MKPYVHACVMDMHIHYSKHNTGLMTQEIEILSLTIKEEEAVRISLRPLNQYTLSCVYAVCEYKCVCVKCNLIFKLKTC